jgi:hypothetical protein
MTKEMSLLSVEINEMMSGKSKTKSSGVLATQPVTATKSTSGDMPLVGLQIPSFDPVCSFDQIKSHTADQDEVTPEDEDEE